MNDMDEIPTEEEVLALIDMMSSILGNMFVFEFSRSRKMIVYSPLMRYPDSTDYRLDRIDGKDYILVNSDSFQIAELTKTSLRLEVIKDIDGTKKEFQLIFTPD